MATRVVEIKIDGNAGNYEATVTRIHDKTRAFTKDATDGAERTGRAFTQMQANVIAFNQALELTQKFVQGVNRVFQSLIAGASAQEEANNRLNASLEITGRQIPTERFTKFASEIQKVTRFEDEAVLSSVTLLAQLTDLDEQGLQKAARGAIGLAAVLDKDLQSATLTVARALTGNAQGLQRVGISINENLSLQEQQRQVMEKLSPLFKRAEADTRTYAGATAQLRNVVGDLAEEIGTPLVNSLTGVARAITPTIQHAIEWVTRNRELVATITTLVAVVAGSAGLTVAIGFLATTIGAFITNPVGLVAFVALLGVGAAAFVLLRGRINEFTESLSKAGAQSGLARMTDELKKLEAVRDQIAAKPRFTADSPLNAEQKKVEAEIAALKGKITEREKLVSQFASQTIVGGSLPQIVDKNAEADKKRAAEKAKRDAERAAAEAKRLTEQEAEAVNRLTVEQAKLNLTNLETARSSGQLSEAQRKQGLTVGNLDDAIEAATLALIEQEKQAALTAARHDKILTPALEAAIEQQARSKITTFEAAEASLKRKDALEIETKALAAKTKAEEDAGQAIEASSKAGQEIIAQIDAEIQQKQILANLDIEYLQILGLTDAALRKELATIIELTEERKRLLEARGIQETAEGAKIRTAQIRNAQREIEGLGSTTINVGHAVADTLVDMVVGISDGTLKGINIVKAAGSSILGFLTDTFAQVLQKKLSFEITLLANARALPGQMNAAAAQGGQGGGGFLSALFGGGGSSFGFGSAPAGVEGPLMANGGFFSNPLGAMGFGGGGGGMGGTLGAGIFGGLLGLLTSALSGGFEKGQLGGTLGSTIGGVGGGIAGSFFGPVGTLIGSFIGSTLGKLIGSLFGGVPNPTVTMRAQFSGIFYDALQDVFKPGTVTTKVTGSQDIAGSVVKQTKTEVQSILEDLSKSWTDILNIFPIIVHDQMIPSLTRANEILNTIFKHLKFSEGGSRTIADEIELLATKGGPQRFFLALRETIGKGIAGSLNLAGLTDAAGLVPDIFTGLPEGITTKAAALKAPGLVPKGKPEDIEKFTEALKAFSGITSGLATISPRGVGQFLTEKDFALLNEKISGVLGSTSSKLFTKGVEDLQEKLKGVLDFLQQSVQQTADIFGRGMIAALEAASESQALRAFNQSLGQGVKDIIFQGITEAFISSAQFNDLLAPIQQTIRDFTQQAIATGTTPDIGAFRQAIFPQIEDFTTRAETLEPLIAELRKLGFDIKDGLKALTGASGGASGITIQIGSVDSDERVKQLMQEAESLIRGYQLMPPPA